MDEYSARQKAEDAKNQQQTFERVQRMHSAIKTADDKDKIATAYTEYAQDSTYRQSEEYEAARKIDRGFDYASLLASDNHIVSNRSTFLKKTDVERQALLDEYQQTAGALLQNEFGKDYLKTNTHQSIAERGVFVKESNLTQEEADVLQMWLNNAADNRLLGKDPMGILQKHGIDASRCNATYLRSQVAAILQDGKVVTTTAVNSQQKQAAVAMMKDKDTLSSEDISTVMDTLRTKKIGELSTANESVKRFLEQHPQADRRAWQDMIKRSKHAQEQSTRRGTELAEEFLDKDAVDAIENIFENYGEITESTGLFQQNAWRGLTNLFLGEMAAPINTAMMVGGIAKKSGGALYNRYLRKSKNEATKEFRENMLRARESLRTTTGRENLYNAKREIKDLRAKRRFERHQTRLFGADRTKWQTYTPKARKAYQNTIKAKILKKLDNPVSRFVGKIFGLKAKLMNFVTGIFKKALLWLGKGFLCLVAGAVVVAPIFTVAYMSIMTFLYMFKCLEPEYAQNCINNLNYLDKWYVQTVENEIYYDYAQQDEFGIPNALSKFVHPEYETYIRFPRSNARVGQFIDEYGKELSSGNNILPIFTAFKFRTGADVNEDTYVAASAYGQMLYWRTHKVSKTYTATEAGIEGSEFVKQEKRDITTCSGRCEEPYIHTLGGGCGTSISRPYNLFLGQQYDDGLHREYCDNYTYEFWTINPYTRRCYGRGLKEHPRHVSSCYGVITTAYGVFPYLACSLPIHEHDFEVDSIRTNFYVRTGLNVDGTTPIYSATPEGSEITAWETTCGLFTVSCNGHCAGHLNVERNVQCIMDIQNIVKEDDLVFTPDALTFGSDVLQGAGNREWKGLVDPYNLTSMEIFYNICVENVTYGSGAKEAKMFRDFDSTDALTSEERAELNHLPSRAIFYNNASLGTHFINNLSGSSSRWQLLNGATKNQLKASILDVFKNNDWQNRYAVNVRLPILAKEKVPAEFKTEIKEMYQLTDNISEEITNAADYVSPFAFDAFGITDTVAGNSLTHYLFRNGWGYFPKTNVYNSDGTNRGEWKWFVDDHLLNSASGYYTEGYRYAVEAFQTESNLYFTNGAPPVDIATIENPLLRRTVEAVRAMEEDINKGQYSAPNNASAAFKTLFNYMRGVHAWNYGTSPHAFYGFGAPVIQEDTILGKKFLTNTENTVVQAGWRQQRFGYHYLYVISEAANTGNAGAKEKYYYCLIYDTDDHNEKYHFRFVTMSEKNLEFFDSAYQNASSRIY